MPRYAALIYGAETTQQPSEQEMGQVAAEYVEFGEKAGVAGVILGGEALHDTNTATTVRVEGGKGGEIITTDGPFAETKEQIAGMVILECADLDEAIEAASRHPAAGYGTIEVRPMLP